MHVGVDEGGDEAAPGLAFRFADELDALAEEAGPFGGEVFDEEVDEDTGGFAGGALNLGVAVDACLTFSIGFRAPHQKELAAAFGADLTER